MENKKAREGIWLTFLWKEGDTPYPFNPPDEIPAPLAQNETILPLGCDEIPYCSFYSVALSKFDQLCE